MCHQAASAWDDLGQQGPFVSTRFIKFSTGYRLYLLTVDSAEMITSLLTCPRSHADR